MKLSPTTAANLATGAAEFVKKKFGFDLPYTPESLIVVDAIIDKIKATGASEQQATGLLSGLGCYAGEVFVRHARASWRWTTEMKMAAACRFLIVIALPDISACDVIGSVFQRFSGGTTEGVTRLYELAVAPRANDRASKATPDLEATRSRANGSGERSDR